MKTILLEGGIILIDSYLKGNIEKNKCWLEVLTDKVWGSSTMIRKIEIEHLTSERTQKPITLRFFTSKMSNIQALINFFTKYSKVSGQVFNLYKSFIYSRVISNRRLERIIRITRFTKDTLSFNSLGVYIFKGRVQTIYIQALIDSIISKLSSWKIASLSISGRATLV